MRIACSLPPGTSRHCGLNNDCSDPGGHVWLAKDGEVRCIHCDRPAMPVYASREA